MNPPTQSGKSLRLNCPLALLLVLVSGCSAPKGGSTGTATPPPAGPAAHAPFAPASSDDPLAATWNDPDFQRRLLGSYGFLPEAEPKMTAAEQTDYRDNIVPLLRDDPAKAIEALRSRVKPDSSAIFDYTLATAFFQSNDLTNAVRYYESALEKFRDFRRAQKNLALSLVRMGRHEQAIPALSRTLALGGGDGKVYGLLGYSYMSVGQLLSAEAAYRQAALFEPDSLDLKMGLARCQIGLGQHAAALALLDELIQRHPERESLWVLQANLFVQLEQSTKAISNLEAVRKLGKASAKDLGLLGDLYLAQEMPDLALNAYAEAVEREGGQNLLRGLRAAELLAGRGAWDESQQLATRLRQVAGENLAAEDEMRLLKLEARLAISRNQGENAIRLLEQVAQKNPLDGEALLLAGDYYARAGESEKALFRYETAGKLTGFEADALVKQAQLLVQTQKYLQAADLLRQAQKIKPRDHIQRYLEKVDQAARNTRS